MGKAKRWLLVLLGALFLCCTAVFAVGVTNDRAYAADGVPSLQADNQLIPESIELSANQGGATIWSSLNNIQQLAGYLSGTIHFADGTTAPLSDYRYNWTVVAEDLRPGDEIAANGTYTRDVWVVLDLNGTRVESSHVELTITADTITSIIPMLTGSNVFEANSTIEGDSFNVYVYYEHGIIPVTYPGSDCTITYNNGKNLVFGDTSVTVTYTEGTQSETATLSGLDVLELPIDVPVSAGDDAQAGSLIDLVYDGEEKSKVFSTYDPTMMTYKKSDNLDYEVNGNSITFTATEVGTYSVTFTVKGGFQWRASTIPAYGDPKDDPSKQQIVSVTYTWEIVQAEFTGIEFDFESSGWAYIGSHQTDLSNADKAPKNITAHYDMANGENREVAISDENGNITSEFEGAVTIVYEKETAPDTWTQVQAEDLKNGVPNDAGSYRVKVAVAETDNFHGAESDYINFTIAKATNTVTYAGASWQYGETPVTLDAIKAGLSSAFDADLGEIDDGDIVVTLTYNNADTPFTISESSLDWNVGTYYLHVYYPGNDNVAAVGSTSAPALLNGTGTIEVEKGTIIFGGSLSMSGWTYGDTAQEPSGVTVSVGGDNGRTELDASTVGGYYFSANGTNYQTWADFLAANGGTALNAGDYTVRYQVAATDNYDAAYGTAVDFTVLRKQVTKPTLTLNDPYTYTGSAQTVTVNNFVADIMNGTTGGGSVTFNNNDALTATNAGDYTLTVTLKGSNYTWTGAGVNPGDTPSSVVLEWTIDKAQNEITAADAFAGWTYGNLPTDVDTLGAQLAFTQDGQQIDYTFYKGSNVTTGTAYATGEMPKDAPVGSYTLVLSVEETANTLGCTKVYTFAVEQGSATISASLENTTTWQYKDDLSDHELTLTSGTVNGTANLTFTLADCNVQYQVSDGAGGWSNVTLADTLGAGNYRVVVSLKDTTNYTADDYIIEFTIQKFVVDIPDFDRTEEYDTAVWYPTGIPTSGERGAMWTISYEDNSSTAVGVYYLTLTFIDQDNYEWNNNFELPYVTATGEHPDHYDESSGTLNKSIVHLYYAITKTEYGATLTVQDFTYGETIEAPTLNIQLSGQDLAEVNAAEQLVYYRPASGGEWISYTDDLKLSAGTYEWRVTVAETDNFSFSAFDGDFTVNPKVLGAPQWNGLTTTYGTTNAASATFEGIVGTDDLNLTYTYSGTANDGTTTYNGATVPTMAGSYKVTVTIGNKNYVVSGNLASPVYTSETTYTVNRASITIEVNDAETTYGSAAPAYTYALASGTLYYGDDLTTVLANLSIAYEDGYTAGDDATTYTVSFTENSYTVANYTVATESGTLTVKPFELEVTITNPSSLVYDGSAKEATYQTNIESGFAGTQPELTLSYQVQGNGSEWSDLDGAPTQVGTYRAVVTMVENTNYTYTTTNGTEFTIATATISVTEKSTDNIWYTGDAYTLANYLKITTVAGLDYEVEFTVNSNPETELTEAGNYTVYYIVTADNHAPASGDFTLHIQKNTLVWSTEYSRGDWTYGGTATAETTPVVKFANGTAANGIIGTAEIKYYTDSSRTQAYDGSFDSATPAGTYYVTVTVAGSEGNFDALVGQYSFTVQRAALTIAANNFNIVYNAEVPTYTATIEGFVNGETAERLGLAAGTHYVFDCNYAKGSPVGDYTITVKAGTTEIENYTVTYVAGTVHVTAQALEFAIGEMSDEYRTYNGSPIAYLITATGAVDGEKVDLAIYYRQNSGDATTTAPTNAGTYTVTVDSATGDDNYQYSGWSATFTIRPREVDVTWTQTDTTFTYNGTVQSGGISASYQLWENGSESNTTASMTVTLTSGGDTFTNAGDYTFTASFTGGSYDATYGYLSADGNYCMADTNGGRTQGYSIGQRPITVTVTPQSREYGDGFDIPTNAINVTTTAEDGYDPIVGNDDAYTLQVEDEYGNPLNGTPNVDTYYIRLVETLTDKNYAVTLESSTPGSGNTVLYSITQRRVTISFTGGTNVIYGNNVDENALRDLIAFSRTNGSGDAFLGKDSAVQADVLAALNFNLGGYTVTSNAGSTFNITISGMDSVGSASNYTFAYSDAEAELTVDKRPITFAIASKLNLTYGTNAVWEASNSLSAELTSGTFANGHNAGNVYTLGVYDEDGTLITGGWDSLAVGSYYIVGTAFNTNYAVIFTGDANYDGGTGNAGTFEVIASEIVVTVNSSTEVWYTGGEYALLDGSALSAFATDVLDFTASTGTGADLSYEFTIQKNNSNSTLVDAGEYTVNYTVKADNYEDKTGSFKVVIKQNAVTWTDPDRTGWGWTYGNADAAAPITEGNVSQIIAAEFVNETADDSVEFAFTVEYFTDASGNNEYTGGFDSTTDAGIYYIRVSIADTANYTGYTAQYSFTVEQKQVTVNWDVQSFAQDAASGAINRLRGYDPTVIEFYTSDSFEADDIKSDSEGYYVEVPDALGEYWITFELIDPDNYDWYYPDDGNTETRTIRFTVSQSVITVEVTQNGWTYGVAEEDLPDPVVTISPTVSADASTFVFAYAAGEEGISDDDRENLGYAVVDDLTMLPAGSYWLRVLVPAAEDNIYGMAFGYAHFTVSPRELTAPTDADETEFTYDGNAQTYTPSGFAATYELPNGQTVDAMVLSGNTGVNAGDYTAIVSLASGNFVWASGSDPIAFEWTISLKALAKPTIGAVNAGSGDVSYTSAYLPGEDQSLAAQLAQLYGFDAELMSFSVTSGASYANGNVAANNVGEYTVTISFKSIAGNNYCWAGETGDAATAAVELTWTITPATFDLGDYGFEQDEYTYEYNGELQRPTLGNPPTGVRVTGYTGGATNVSQDAQTVTATLALVGPYATNFRFNNNDTEMELTATVTITAVTVDSVVWSTQNNFAYTGDDLSEYVHAYFIKADGSVGDLTIEVNGDNGFVNAGGYTFTVTGFADPDDNYVLAEEFIDKTSGIYTIEKVAVTVVVEDAEPVVYTGNAPDLDTVGAANEYGYYGFVVMSAGNTIIRSENLPQRLDKTEWAAITAALAQAGGSWNVGSYTITLSSIDLTNYEITHIEYGYVTVTPATITDITITVPNADGMVYGKLMADDAAYIDPNSDVTVLLGDGTETTIKFSEVADYISLWYSGYAEGKFATDVNAGTVWVFPLMKQGAVCNYTFTDSSEFAEEFTVQKQTVESDDFTVTDVYYTGNAQTLPRDNVAYIGGVQEFAEYFDAAGLILLNAGENTNVGDYIATLTLSDAVYRNYCFENGSSLLRLTWSILPLEAEDVTVTAPQLTVVHWGENTAASVTVKADSTASAGENELNVTAFRYEYQYFDGEEWASVTVGSDFVWTAGDYRVRGVIADGNFPAAMSVWSEFTVNKGTYNTSVLDWSDATAIYDGTEHNLTLRVGGVPDSDGLLTAAQLYAADGIGLTYAVGEGLTEVGSKQISVTVTATSPNYTFDGGAATFALTATITVEARYAAVVWEGANFVYNGGDQSARVTAYFYDANNERIELAVAADRAFINAGNYTFTVTDAPAGYVLVGGQEDFTIAPKSVSVVWSRDNFVYNGEDQFGSVRAYFIDVNGDAVMLALRAFEFRNVNEGGYTFDVIGAADEGFALANYTLVGTTEVLHISPLAVTVTADDKSVIYGESAALTWHASSEVFVRDAEDGLVVVLLTRQEGSEIGSYVISIDVGGMTANYTLRTVDGVYTILPQSLRLQIVLPEDRVYDGRPVAATLVSLDGVLPADVYLYYTGTANDGTAWSSAEAPVKAGTYTVEARTSNASLTIVCEDAELVIERAEAVIDTSGVRTHYVYTGAEQTVEGGATLNHGETTLVYANNTFTTVAEGDGLRVRIYAAQTANYEAAEVYVTITVERQAIAGGLAVSIDDWTYGEEANGYRLSGNLGGGAVSVLYTGTTNAGEAYESDVAPTEAGEYMITVTVAQSDDYFGGVAADDFAVLRAEADLSVAIEGWAYGQTANEFELTPAFLAEYIQSVTYTDGSLIYTQPPTQAGRYTLTVQVGVSPNYLAGSAEATFTVARAEMQLSVSVEGWTYGQKPNEPVIDVSEGCTVTLRYTGNANDGTFWDASEAPTKAGSFKLTVTAGGDNYNDASAVCTFTVARALVEAPSLREEGLREAASVYDGKTVSVAVLGYDGTYMQVNSAARIKLENGQIRLIADKEGTYTVIFTLTDAANYAWAAEEGEDFSQGVVLTWTVTEKIDSLLWLIILLAVLALILLVLLIVFINLKKRAQRPPEDGGAPQDGGYGPAGNGGAPQDGGYDPAGNGGAPQDGGYGPDAAYGAQQNKPLYALAPMGLLVVPTSHIAAVAALAVVVAALLIADIVAIVKWRKAVRARREAEAALTDAQAYPVDENGYPVDMNGYPVDENGYPVDENGYPVDTNGAPVAGEDMYLADAKAPAEAEVAPAEAEVAPAEAEEAPAEAEEAPAEAEEVPADVEEAPAEAEEVPAEAEEVPAEAEEVPAEAEEVPAEEEEVPADVEEAPAEAEEVPADVEEAPAEAEEAPADAEEAPEQSAAQAPRSGRRRRRR